MLMKELLNQFEADWAQIPSLEPHFDFSIIKNKTFLISGHDVARCFAYALLFLNDSENLNTKVYFTGNDTKALKNFHPEILSRKDFSFVSTENLNSIDKVDFIIDGGVCGANFDFTYETFAKEIAIQKALVDFAGKIKPQHFTLLSDCRFYGHPGKYRVYSEMELGEAQSASVDDFDTQLLRTIENICACGKKQYGFNSVTLRTGVVLGAFSKIKTPLDDLFDAVANCKPYNLVNSKNKYSFAYISDISKAVIYSLFKLKDNQVYNVVSKDATVSTSMIMAMLHDIYGDEAKINLVDGEEPFRGSPINANKIEFYGCEPKIPISTALQLSILSRRDITKPLCFPNAHDGRLKSVQQILLAYLLELDRICKKHNIKYFLGGGTLLGAVRHEGFIPWDDDADIMMLREDYDKFLEIAPKEMPKWLTFQTDKTDKFCHYPFAKFRLDNTMFATVFSREHKEMHNGMSFDIFCHDKTSNNKFFRKLHIYATIFFRSMVFNKWNHRKVDNGNKISSAICNVIKNILPISFSQWAQNVTLTMYKNKKDAKYLYDGTGRNVYHGEFPASYLDETIYTDFEGYKFPIPKEYDKYLTYLYGDYKTLAPLSSRLQCHEILLFDLGEYDGFVKRD